jgi:hypothetical protein
MHKTRDLKTPYHTVVNLVSDEKKYPAGDSRTSSFMCHNFCDKLCLERIFGKQIVNTSLPIECMVLIASRRNSSASSVIQNESTQQR